MIIAVLAGAGWGGYTFYQQEFANGAGNERSGRGRGGPGAVGVETEAALMRNLSQAVEAVGTTRAIRSVEIVPLADGRVTELNITPGGEVEEGAVIARLDDDIERANLSAAEGTLLQKQQAAERAARLRESQTVSLAALETLRAEEIVARAAVDRAQRQLDDRTIRAPFAGVLGLTSIDVGARVEAGDRLTTLDDLSKVEVEFQLPETLFARAKPGLGVVARGSAFPGRTFEGRIVAVDSRVDRNSRSFLTRAELPNPDRTLPSGMFVLMSITLDDYEAVTVPDAAIVSEGSNTFVYRILDGKAAKTKVATGLRERGLVEIRGGLAAGDLVAVTGLQRLRDGAEVNVLNSEPATSDAGKLTGAQKGSRS
ncbi:efflux RND transporter periplasmic adaptor subunit [Stappia sp. GBMRC 2046]|uniref:Efflux RND transporter periplasmic adaptor subunit n=1 Tax=Stappia sediminis TaxID=2692190 RepID=A0A7X3S8Q6_9HYPH|nr:efflux RND transporter periplasmic adaptor subunit [Stappia sediminis]